MLIRLDPTSEAPIYRQLTDSIRQQVDRQDLKPGDRLPSARDLGETLGINMHTVLKAYSELESRGYLEIRRGRGGVRVREPADIRVSARGLAEMAAGRGMTPEQVQRIIEEVWP